MECGLGGAGPVTLIALHRTEQSPNNALHRAGARSENTWRAPMAKTFTGEIIVGEDVMLV